MKNARIKDNTVLKDNHNSDKKKFRILKVIVFMFFVLYAFAFLYMLTNKHMIKITISNGNISDEQSVVGYVIRDEVMVKTNLVSDVSLLNSDEDRAAKNQVIASYINKTETDWKNKIQELDTKIQAAMQNKAEIFSNDTKNIDLQIEELINKANNTNDINKLIEYKLQINTLLEKKAKITGELSPVGSQIKQLIEERTAYEKKLNDSSDYIKAPKTGIVSTRIDTLEDKLTVNRIPEIKYSELEEYKLRTDELVPNNSKQIKIVENYYCYLAVLVKDARKDTIKVGDKIKVRLNFEGSNNTLATVDRITDQEDGKLVFLKITNNVEKLIGYRKISFDIIWWEYEGLKVPNEAIVGAGDDAKVILLKYGQEYETRVKILKQNDDYAIITNLTKEDAEKLGISVDEIKRNVTIYDELVIR